MTEALSGASPSRLWAILAGATGALILLQTGVGTLLMMVLSTATLSQGLTLVAATTCLVLGLSLRSPLVLLFLFPATLLATLITMPDIARAAIYQPWRWALWMVSMAAYSVATTSWLSHLRLEAPNARCEPLLPETSGTARVGRRNWEKTHTSATRVAMIRVAAMAALLVAPAASLLVAAPSSHFQAHGPRAALFAHALLLFGWCVVTYVFLVAPTLEGDRPTSGEYRRTKTAGRRGAEFALLSAGMLLMALLLWITR